MEPVQMLLIILNQSISPIAFLDNPAYSSFYIIQNLISKGNRKNHEGFLKFYELAGFRSFRCRNSHIYPKVPLTRRPSMQI